MGATCRTKQPLMDYPWRSRCIPEAFLVFTRAWHFSLETCRLFREFALKGPLREQMAQRTGKDYQRGKGSSSVVKSFVNSWKKKREIGYHGPWKKILRFNISPFCFQGTRLSIWIKWAARYIRQWNENEKFWNERGFKYRGERWINERGTEAA